MNPQSSRTLARLAKDGIKQVSNIVGVPLETHAIKIRWKVSYQLKGEVIEDAGENNSVYVG
jgi:hypothetical protein